MPSASGALARTSCHAHAQGHTKRHGTSTNTASRAASRAATFSASSRAFSAFSRAFTSRAASRFALRAAAFSTVAESPIHKAHRRGLVVRTERLREASQGETHCLRCSRSDGSR